MKKITLPFFLLLCLNFLSAQQQEGVEGVRMAPRANIVSYDDANAVEKLRYAQSSNYISVSSDWQKTMVEGRPVHSQQILFPKEWRAYRLFFRFQAAPGYGFWVDDKLIGISHDSRAFTEFDISEQVRYGKNVQLAIRYAGDDDGALIESECEGLTGDCAVLLKPLENVQDYTINTHYNNVNQSGQYTIDADVYNHNRKGKCYLEVEIWDPQGRQVDKTGKWLFFSKVSESTISLSSTIASVQPWNAETPRLYTAVIRLYDEDMSVQDIVGTRFGFRSISTEEGFLINGSKITFKGVTIVPPIDLSNPDILTRLRTDMMQMKRNNINALRVSFANSPTPFIYGEGMSEERFFELCDELGFYVVCDANLQPRSSMGHAVAADNEFSELFSDRMRALYHQYKNHTCIVAWSLGNSPDNGICMTTAYRTLKQLDKQRPVIYSGAQYSDNTDFIAPIDCNTEFLRQYQAKKQSRPLLMLSYGSDVGNTFGGMVPLWQRVFDQDRLLGGFFKCRNWHNISDKPYLSELRQLYRPIDVRLLATSPDAAEFSVTNRSDFRPLADYKLEYVICTNLRTNIVEGDVVLSVQPGESKTIKIKVPKLTLSADEEMFIRFELKQRGNIPAVPRNTVLATWQFALMSEASALQPFSDNSSEPLTLEKNTAHQYNIYNTNYSLQYNDSLGCITSWSYRGHQLLSSPLRLGFLRTPSANDMSDPNGWKQWKRYGNNLRCEVLASNCRQVDKGIGIDVMLRYFNDQIGTCFDVRQTYMLYPSGDVLLSNDIRLSDQIKSLARVGCDLCLASDLQKVEWFGRNVESYPDRCASGLIAQQSEQISQITYPYQPLQHSGNHTDVRWVAVGNDSVALYVDLLDTLCHFSIMGDTLSVNYREAPVGGGANMFVQESALLKASKYQFTLHLRPFERSEHQPNDFRRINYPQVNSGVVEMPVISSSRDRFDGPMQIAIVCPTPDAEIRYTLDGSVPSEHSMLYTKPFVITGSTQVLARAYKRGATPSFVASQQFSFDYILGCTFAHKANTPYNRNAEKTLIDGELGDVNDLSRGWVGFSGHDFQADFELGKVISLSHITARFAHVPEAWVFAPAQVFVSVSSDGQHYSQPVAATITFDAADSSQNTPQLQIIELPVQYDNVRFVRLVAKPIPQIPSWHRAKGLKPWLLLDEVIIAESVQK